MAAPSIDALLVEARQGTRTYERQDELARDVRVWGDTAVVTAKLWLKGTTREGPAFDYVLWFSDTWVRQPGGWRYVLGQASLRLPAPSPPRAGHMHAVRLTPPSASRSRRRCAPARR
jgi:hypothetical protein